MASIAVVTSSPPDAEGGHIVIARSLVRALGDAGHHPHLVLTPECTFGHQAPSYLDTWRLDVEAAARARIDQVISLRFPSYAIRHPRHVCWLNHTMREYYDLWPRFARSISWRARVKERVKRAIVRTVDRYLLTKNVTGVVAQSHTIARRLLSMLRVRAEVLWPPAPPRPYRCDEYGDFILAVSRLTPLKRLDLLVRALAEAPAAAVRLVIAGDGESRPALERLARDLGVAGRVTFTGHADDGTLVNHLARCRAVAFAPYDEDYGFVTIEAFSSRKPIVTCTDSGGPTELVRDGVNGFVVPPTAAALGTALARLADDRRLAEELGARAQQHADAITWRATVQRLVIV